jgi:hemoglobin
MASGKPDLDSRERVEAFVDAFYARLLADPVMAPIFFDVADIDLAIHLPHIKDYWSKLLLGEAAYRRHTMNIHRAVHAKRTLDNADFDRWLQHFSAAIEQG